MVSIISQTVPYAALYVGASGGAFNPTSLFGGGEQGVIYDFTNTSTMFQERTGASATTPSGVDGPIGTLKDLSPNNNYAIASTDAARPLSRQGVGAPNVYGDFDGVNDFLRSTFSINQAIVRISCVAINTFVFGVQIFGGATANAGALYISNAGSQGIDIFSGSTLTIATSVGTSPVVFVERHNGVTSRGKLNNGSYSSGTAGTALPGGVTISASSASSQFVSMRAMRVVEIGRDLTDPEIANCVTWCGAAGGLVL